MFCKTDKYVCKFVIFILLISIKTRLILTKGGQAITSKEIETQSSTSIKPERLPASRFRIFPNTTWKNGSNVCLHFNNRLMPAYNSDVIRTELLPLMDSRDFVWISIKDYGLSCELREENNTTGEKVCSSFVRVSKKPTSEKLNYGLCEKDGEIQRQSFSSNPVTWYDLEKYCAYNGRKLYQFSSLEEGWTLLSLIQPGQMTWIKKYAYDFPDFGDNDHVVEMCVGLVKLDDDRFIYMADDCDSEHNFVCDTTNSDHAPAVEVFFQPSVMYESDEVEKAMTQTFEFTTLQSNYTDSAGKVTRVMYQSDEVEKAVTQTFEFTTLKSNYTDYVDEADQSYALTEESSNTGAIVGAVVGALVVVVAAGLFYRYVKKRKERAYRSSVFRYETKKASTFNGHMPCKEITHLTLPELETSSYTEETPLEKTHEDVYYEKRYEPLQRELVDACTKKLQSRKTGHKDSSRTDCNMLPSDTYDPLRKDHFLKMGHDSSCSDGLTISYEKYDPDSEELTHQTFQKSALQPPKNKNSGIGATVSYLSHVKTLDDLGQYESMEEKGKPLKDRENQVKKLDDLDQYENYTHSPIPPLPSKKTAMTVPNVAKCSVIDEQNEPDCYENYDG